MKPSRRDFVRVAALVTGSIPFAGGFDELYADQVPFSSIRERLSEKRKEIKTLHAVFELRTDKPHLFAGQNQLFFKKGSYHLRHDGEPATIITIVQASQVLDAVLVDGVVEKVKVRKRTHRDPGTSLDTFLPQLEDKPMVSSGMREIAEETCRGILQGERRYWISTQRDLVLAVDLFETAEKVRETIAFLDFIRLSPKVWFPGQVRIESVDSAGKISSRLLEITSVVMNEPVSDELFTIDRFPRSGERIRL